MLLLHQHHIDRGHTQQMAKLNIRQSADCTHDFTSLGAIVRRFDPGIIPLHEATHYEIHCSGGEYNPAAALATTFGLRAAVLSASVEYPPGWWIATQARKMGVEAYLKWFGYDGVGSPRIAAIYSDRGYGARPPEVWYDRANEAGALLKPGDFDFDELFGRRGVRWFHSGGIFAALSSTTGPLIIEAMQAARKHGVVTSYDLNFREKLWKGSGGSERGVEVNRAIVANVDVLFGNEEDLQLGLGISGPDVSAGASKLDTSNFRSMIETLLMQYPNIKLSATTLREVQSAARHSWKAVMWYDADFYESPACELDIYDRVGGGDGFASGLMYGMLTDQDPLTALKLGWAHGALLTTYPGDVSMARLDQVERLAEGGSARIQR